MTSGRGAAAVLVPVVVLVATGALAGVVWWWVWTPPTGVVIDQRWVLDARGLARDFDGTAWYVVVGSAAGLLGGAAVSWTARGRELGVLVALVVGSVLGGWVMYQVGHALGPADPQVLAKGRADLTALPGELRVGGVDASALAPASSAFVAFPGGALSAAAAVFLMTERRERLSATHARR